jgi:uncharacterized protein YjdB
MKNLALHVAPALIALAFAACSEDDATTVPVEGVRLSSQTMLMAKGGEDYHHAWVLPEDATDQTIGWASNSEAVKVVSFAQQTATIRAVEDGTATITVTTNDGKRTGTCEVTVVTVGVTLPPNFTLAYGDSRLLVANVTPEAANERGVTWRSDNEDVATVENGLVIAQGSGRANIIVTTNLGKQEARVRVTVP